MTKRVEFSPDGSLPYLADPSVFCPEPEVYQSYKVVPDEAWAEYEAAYKVFQKVLQKMHDSCYEQPLSEQEAETLKAKFLEQLEQDTESRDDDWFSVSRRRDLGMSRLAPQVYGEEFVKTHALSWEEYQAWREKRKNDLDLDSLLIDTPFQTDERK